MSPKTRAIVNLELDMLVRLAPGNRLLVRTTSVHQILEFLESVELKVLLGSVKIFARLIKIHLRGGRGTHTAATIAELRGEVG